MTNSLTVVAKVFSNTLVFLLQKCEKFCNAKSTHIFFSAKISMYDRNFNVTLANKLLCFE